MSKAVKAKADGTVKPLPETCRMNQKGTALLAAAIVARAVQDWKDARAMLARVPDCRDALNTVDETERFFRSRWYQLLRGITPEIPQDMLRRLNGDK